MSNTLDETLIELEKIGWPCRLVELPAKYDRACRKLNKALEALRWLTSFYQDGDRKALVDAEPMRQCKRLIAELEEVK